MGGIRVHRGIPTIPASGEKGRSAWFEGTFPATKGHTHPASPELPLPPLFWVPFCVLKYLIVVRWKEGGNIFSTVKDKAVVTNLTSKPPLLVALYLAPFTPL